MKSYYYFSKSKLKFVEIKNFKKKLFIYVGIVALVFSFLLFGGFYYITSMLNPNSKIEELRAENELLRDKVDGLINNYQAFNEKLDSLSELNNNLRLSVNLESFSEEERDIGIGGSKLRDFNNFSFEGIETRIDSIDLLVQNLNAKLNFEKESFEEIKTKVIENSSLYDAIPALRPAEGYFGDRFGMRKHPILNIRRMHNGIDIVCNIGTEVYATGNGVVTFARRNGTMGKMIKIDHGFGYKTVYGHLYRFKVKRGQKVKRGDLIALSGKSGLSTGAHLHYEVYHNGIALNPRNFIYDDIELTEFIAKKN